MRKFNNMDSLNKYIIEQIYQVQSNSFYDCIVEIWNKYMDDYYNDYTPDFYVRSFEIRDKFPIKLNPIKKGKSITWTIKFDSGVLSNDEWENKGMSGYRHDEDSGFSLEAVLIEGLHGLFKGKTKPYDELLKDIKSGLLTGLLKDELIRRGFSIQ